MSYLVNKIPKNAYNYIENDIKCILEKLCI
jgi:hypothetical protein